MADIDITEQLRINSCRYAHESPDEMGTRRIRIEFEAADLIESLRAKLREAHQDKLALWEAIAGGPGPRCRDCADFSGRCQGNGLPCDPQARALEQIATLRTSVERASTPDPIEAEILSIVRVWRECPAARRPSAAAFAERVIAALSPATERANG